MVKMRGVVVLCCRFSTVFLKELKVKDLKDRCWQEVGRPSDKIRTILNLETGEVSDYFDCSDERIDRSVATWKKVHKAHDDWVAAGRPWTADNEAFLDRMTGY
jgi:hypothetical protein